MMPRQLAVIHEIIMDPALDDLLELELGVYGLFRPLTLSMLLELQRERLELTLLAEAGFLVLLNEERLGEVDRTLPGIDRLDLSFIVMFAVENFYSLYRVADIKDAGGLFILSQFVMRQMLYVDVDRLIESFDW